MENTTTFFSEKGLTSTSANHVSNLAKELIQNEEIELSQFDFFNTSISFIGTNQETIINFGVEKEMMDSFSRKLQNIYGAKSLIAWLREGIKEKERRIQEIKGMTMRDYCQLKEIEIPEPPMMKESITEKEYYDSLSIGKRNKYFSLEAKAATIGKFIHPEGEFSNARNRLKIAIKNPIKILGEGKDALVERYSSTLDVEEVDNCFFKLQKEYRETQAELNSIKSECEKALIEDKIAKETEFNVKLSEYENKVNLLNSELSLYKTQEIKRINELKIIIPDNLSEICKKIQKLGK